MADYDAMRLAEMASISEYLHELDEEQWDRASLCDGWRIRDVISHMCVGYTTPMPVLVAKIARKGFSVPRASRDESIAYGSAHSPTAILGTFDEIRTKRIKKGIAKVIKPHEALVDHLIHHQDVRRPLDRPRNVPEDRLVAALDVIPRLGGFVGAKKRVAGLHLAADDVGWAHGDGPGIAGPGEAILLAASGRDVALADLHGEGVEVLRGRLAA